MKKIVSLFLIVLLSVLSLQSVYASADIELNSSFAYLYDRETKMVYINQKSEEKIYPASMTKILTVHLSLQKIQNVHEQVTVTKQDLDGLQELGATVAGFYAGEKVTYEDLIYGALLPSGADACYALARLTYGNQEKFVQAMNEYLAELGLKNTHFVNVTGLHDDQHYTTVKDMAMILDDALSNETFIKAFETRSYTSSKKNHTWISSLQRGKEYQNVDISHLDGGKSGFTDEAGLTFASTMTVDSHHLILVTAKATGQYTQNHVKDAAKVYQYMNDNFHNVILFKKDEEIDSIWVIKSFQFQYQITAPTDISLLLQKNIQKSNLQIEKHIKSIQTAPIQTQHEIGVLDIMYQENSIYQYPLLATQTIESSWLATVICFILLGALPGVCVLGIGWIIYKKTRQKKL